MAEYERNKVYQKKKFNPTRIKESTNLNRSFSNSKSEGKSGRESTKETSSFEITPKKQPTILLKAREPTNDEIGSASKRTIKEDTSTNITLQSSIRDNEVTSIPSLKYMTKSMKLIDDNMICTDFLQDYVSENNDFLTVGIVGTHGVGKSTIMNLLAQNQITDQIRNSILKVNRRFDDKGSDIKILTDRFEKVQLKNEPKVIKEVFRTQTMDDIEKAMSRTLGIDIFITSNRLILLDCQPFASISVLEDLIKSESKRTNLVSEFIPLENSGEIQGLQLTTFLMSVCHVLLLVEDWFLDSNVVRFIQTAEILKPTISNPEDELTDHFPHLLIIHNKAQMDDFSPAKFKTMQQAYKMLFHKTKFHLNSDLGMGTGGLINYLNAENCGSPVNFFLVPEIISESNQIYFGHPPLEEIIRKLRANIWGSSRNPLTHVQLSEKTWLVYCAKVWDTVKKSSFFVEYTKLMP